MNVTNTSNPRHAEIASEQLDLYRLQRVLARKRRTEDTSLYLKEYFHRMEVQ